MNSEVLNRKIKTAYEWARFKESLLLLAWTVPLTVFSLWACGTTSLSLCLGSFLSILGVFLLWRGQLLGKAALLGLALGTVAFIVPLVFHLTGICCRADIEKEVCFATGAVVGLLLSRVISQIEGKKFRFTLASLAMIIISGVLGCASLGIGAIAGLIGGIVLPVIMFYAVQKR